MSQRAKIALLQDELDRLRIENRITRAPTAYPTPYPTAYPTASRSTHIVPGVEVYGGIPYYVGVPMANPQSGEPNLRVPPQERSFRVSNPQSGRTGLRRRLATPQKKAATKPKAKKSAAKKKNLRGRRKK